MDNKASKRVIYKNLGGLLRCAIDEINRSETPRDVALNLLAHQTAVSGLALYVAAAAGMDVEGILRRMSQIARLSYEDYVAEARQNLDLLLAKEGGNV